MCKYIKEDKKQCKRLAEPYCYQHIKLINNDKKIEATNIQSKVAKDMSPSIQTATEHQKVVEEMPKEQDIKVVEVDINETLYTHDDSLIENKIINNK